MSDILKGKIIAMVDDDPEIVDTVSDFLTGEGFEMHGFNTAHDLFTYLHTSRPDLIILDIVLPDMNGFQICKHIKDDRRLSTIPVIILSGQDKDTDQIFALDLGALDYLIKPYSLDVLLAKVKAILFRAEKSFPEKNRIELEGWPVIIDLDRYEVVVDGRKLSLTPTEFGIISLLASRPGKVFSRDSILENVWGSETIVLDRTVDVHIRHLRRKLGKHGGCIEVVRGAGYRISSG